MLCEEISDQLGHPALDGVRVAVNKSTYSQHRSVSVANEGVVGR